MGRVMRLAALLLSLSILLTILSCGSSPNDVAEPDAQYEKLNVYTYTNKFEYIPLYDKAIQVTLVNDSPFRVYLNRDLFISIQMYKNGQWLDDTPSGFNEHWFETNGNPDNFRMDIGEPFTLGLLDIRKILNNEKGVYRFKLEYCLQPYSESGLCEAPVPDSLKVTDSFSVLDTPLDLASIDRRFSALDLEYVTDGDTFPLDGQDYVPLSVINRSEVPVFLQPNRPFVIFESLQNGEWIPGLDGDENKASWSFRIERYDYYVLQNNEEVIVRPLNIDNHLVQTPGTYRFNFRMCLEPWDEDLCEANIPDQFSATAPFYVVD